MTRDEATERLSQRLERWRDRISDKVTVAKLLRERGGRLAIELAEQREREAVALERDVLALLIILSVEGESHG